MRNQEVWTPIPPELERRGKTASVVTSSDRNSNRLLSNLSEANPKDTTALAASYQSFRRIAEKQLSRDRLRKLFEPCDLVNELCMKALDPNTRPSTRSSTSCNRIVKNALVDQVRKHTAQKRGGGAEVLQLEMAQPAVVHRTNHEALFAVHEVLDRLKKTDLKIFRVVELRFFEGLTTKEAAVALNVSETTVKTRWNLAKVWLRGHLGPVRRCS